MQEISDPKNKAEYEAYINQMEGDNMLNLPAGQMLLLMMMLMRLMLLLLMLRLILMLMLMLMLLADVTDAECC